MSDIRLLDCTLRDGGYVNDWKFGHDSLVGIFERLVDANVDIIEIGFLDDRRPCRTKYPQHKIPAVFVETKYRRHIIT